MKNVSQVEVKIGLLGSSRIRPLPAFQHRAHHKEEELFPYYITQEQPLFPKDIACSSGGAQPSSKGVNGSPTQKGSSEFVERRSPGWLSQKST